MKFLEFISTQKGAELIVLFYLDKFPLEYPDIALYGSLDDLKYTPIYLYFSFKD